MRGHESLYVMLELRPVPVQDPDIHVPSRTSRSIGLGSRRVSRLRDPKQSPNPPIGVLSQIPVIFAVYAKKRARFGVSLFSTWRADRESIMMRLLLDALRAKDVHIDDFDLLNRRAPIEAGPVKRCGVNLRRHGASARHISEVLLPMSLL